ncbi:MAG: sensor histidine kinase [Planctomycetota bacterium]
MTTSRFRRVLVVEDGAAERALLCEILRDEGFEVAGCGSASEALALIRSDNHGVAIVDLRLPDLSGTELLDRIRAIDSEVRVIIYTGAASYETVRDALNLGAFAYAEKLTDPGELLRHVHRAAHERTQRYALNLEAEVAKSSMELARSNRELDDFVSVVAHDLRSPLLTISGFCQILREECLAGETGNVVEHVDRVTEGVDRMSRLIEDLLSYSRLDRLHSESTRVDTQKTVERVLASYQAALRDVSAKVDVQPLPIVHADPGQMLSLFEHLIGNSIKFRRDVPLEIRVEAFPEGAEWRFAVRDNGVGIRSEDYKRVFEVCQRLHAQEFPGSGIGLAVCRKVVERHGGRIWVESEVGRGSTFFFTLPAHSNDS